MFQQSGIMISCMILPPNTTCGFAVIKPMLYVTLLCNECTGYIVYGTDHGRTAILCPPKVNHFRRSWVDRDRCTAIMVCSTILFSVYMPQSGRDENHIEGFGDGRGRKRVPLNSLFAVILSIEFQLDNTMVNTQAWTASSGTG